MQFTWPSPVMNCACTMQVYMTMSDCKAICNPSIIFNLAPGSQLFAAMHAGVTFSMSVTNVGHVPAGNITLSGHPAVLDAFRTCDFLAQNHTSLAQFQSYSCNGFLPYTEDDLCTGPLAFNATVHGLSGNATISSATSTAYVYSYISAYAGVNFQNCSFQGRCSC